MCVSDRPDEPGSDLSLTYPLQETLRVIGGKWKVIILFVLSERGKHRFAELRRAIPGISERMLTAQLREPERDGLIGRKVFAEVPPKVEYSLTEYGATIRPLCDRMCTWGQKHSAASRVESLAWS